MHLIFTHIEENDKLSFLDMLVTKKINNILDQGISHRKPTHRYLRSHHHPVQKQSAINSLVHRAFIISDKDRQNSIIWYFTTERTQRCK